MPDFYPVYLNLAEKKCLVVGGGKVAERKVKTLLQCGARVYLVSRKLTDWLADAAAEGLLLSLTKEYTTTDLENAFLVIGATDDRETNRRISAECRERNILVNIVDDPAECNFIVPAVVRQGPLAISVSTEGKSPMLARRIREELEESFGPEYREFLEIMGELRTRIISEIPDEEERREMFRRLVYSDIIDLLKDRQHEKVKERINHVFGNCGTQS